MKEKYLLLGLCLAVLGARLEGKTDQDPNDWPVSNTMSREDHEHHVAVRPSETIDIDERPPQGEFYSGDGTDMSDDDGSSGNGWDDEDDMDEGSAVVPQTKCLREFERLSDTMMPGAPSPPRCTLDGEYEKKQCHGSTGHCWCVDKEGLEIGGTRREPGVRLDCNNVVPVFPDPITTPKPRKPPQQGFEEPEDEIQTSDDDLKNSIDNMPVDPDAGDFDIKNTDNLESNQVHPEQHQGNNDPETLRPHALLQPGLLAGIIGGAVVGLLCAVLLVMFIVYRMRKKDEGSYALDEPKRSPSLHTYARATNREFYA